MSKQKEVHTSKAVDDTLDVVNDFTYQIPYWSYKVSAYREYSPFADLTATLDEHLEKLFAGEIDDGNGDVLDCLIADYARENFRYLAQQRVEHCGALKMFQVQREGAKHSFESHYKSIEQTAQEKRDELEELLHRRKRDRFEGGKNNE